MHSSNDAPRQALVATLDHNGIRICISYWNLERGESRHRCTPNKPEEDMHTSNILASLGQCCAGTTSCRIPPSGLQVEDFRLNTTARIS